jgi:tryptophan-rich sensory protein
VTIRNIVGLIVWIGISFTAAGVGVIASSKAQSFYAQLNRPRWAPPGWVFGPVWTTLYAMMGVSAWLVWRGGGWSGASFALKLFIVQLVFNALWTWLFFAWRRGALSIADILILDVLIVATIMAFGAVSALAAVLLIPYICWVLFATALNVSLWRMNPTLL